MLHAQLFDRYTYFNTYTLIYQKTNYWNEQFNLKTSIFIDFIFFSQPIVAHNLV
jgi:hypothetical protein